MHTRLATNNSHARMPASQATHTWVLGRALDHFAFSCTCVLLCMSLRIPCHGPWYYILHALYSLMHHGAALIPIIYWCHYLASFPSTRLFFDTFRLQAFLWILAYSKLTRWRHQYVPTQISRYNRDSNRREIITCIGSGGLIQILKHGGW